MELFDSRKKIVTITGGTGGYTLFTGLKHLPLEVTACLPVTDSGGFSGKLRVADGVLPPGDLVQALAANAESPHWRELFAKRLIDGTGIGHLMLSSLEQMYGREKYLDVARELLSCKARCLPASLDDCHLSMELNDGRVIENEDDINNTDVQAAGVKSLFLTPSVKPNPEAVKAIAETDFIVIGPGNLYGSLAPILLTVGKCVQESPAKVILVVNLTNKKGHTMGFSALDYVRHIESYIGIGRIDYAVMNSNRPPEELIQKYEKQEGPGVLVEIGADSAEWTCKVVTGDFLGKDVLDAENDVLARPGTRSTLVRHDPSKLANVLYTLSYGLLNGTKIESPGSQEENKV